MEGDNWQENSNNSNYNPEPEVTEVTIDKRSTREKVISGIILVVVFLAVFTAYFQLMSSLNGPIVKINSTKPATEICYGGNCGDDQILVALERQTKDTDNDGLTDYDELYIYGTSPYLEDSDSDSIVDGVEVEAGYDPNCAGDSCTNFVADINDTESVPTLTAEPVQTSIQITADDLRNLFVQSGMPASEVEQLTDEEVYELYNSVLAESDAIDQIDLNAQITTPLSQPINDIDLEAVGITSLDDLQDLTGAQIRQLMIQQGATTDILDQISDEELEIIFKDKLESQLAN